MSVIYRSLKKLQSRSDDPAGEPKAGATGERILSFRSAAPLLTGAGVVAAVAVLAAAALMWHRGHQDSQRPIETAQTALNRAEIQFSAAETADEPGDPAAATAPRFLPATPRPRPRAEAAGADSSGPKTAGTNRSPLPTLNRQPAPSKPEGRYGETRRPPASNAEMPAEADELERFRLAALEKSRRIGQLANQIQTALQRGDDRNADRLIGQMAELKGDDQPYVLKLKAYQHIRRGQYMRATTLLNRVMSKNPGDLEAGINLAVVEVKTGRLVQARQRLLDLKQRHPENDRLNELLQQLQ